MLLLSLLYYQYLGQHAPPLLFQWIACLVVLVGLLVLSGGFFLHMAHGKPGHGSAGVLLTNVGATLLGLAVLFLVYLMIAG